MESESGITKQVKDQLPIEVDNTRLEQLKGKTVLIKYGGNAMTDDDCKKNVISDIIRLKELGVIPVVVHGGGPAIKKLLGDVGIESEFIGGHRKTDKEAMHYVEMALSGNVNSEIVKLINAAGYKAVGLSGKDAGMVLAKKRIHRLNIDGQEQEVDLGHVGDVDKIDTQLIHCLIENNYIPVIAPIGVGEDLKDYNINADMFAGHMAGALKADHFMALTNVNGLMADKDDPDTLIRQLTIDDALNQMDKAIQGGMIPKVEACIIALKEGVKTSHIINGMKPHSILEELLTEERSGTIISNGNS